MQTSQNPIIILKQMKHREEKNKALLTNIVAAKSVSDLLKTTLGPNSMMKMIITKMGTVITNDGNCVIRDVNFSHPAAKFIVELSRTQEQESGDGTTTVILLTCEILSKLYPFIKEKKIHPNELIEALNKFLAIAFEIMPSLAFEVSFPFNFNQIENSFTKEKEKEERIFNTLKTTLNSKLIFGNEKKIFEMAFKALSIVLPFYHPFNQQENNTQNNKEEENKRNSKIQKLTQKVPNFRSLIKIEKLPGSLFESSYVFPGVILNKEPISPLMFSSNLISLKNPSILLIEGGIEYQKAESHTEIELLQKTDFEKLIQNEENFIFELCSKISLLDVKLVFCTKGTTALAAHLLAEKGIVAFKRLTKPQLFRLSKSIGGKIVTPGEILSMDGIKNGEVVGKGCEEYWLERTNDEFYAFVKSFSSSSLFNNNNNDNNKEEGKSCTIVLKGGSKELMKEFEANLDDAIGVLISLFKDGRVLGGGGAFEVYLNCKIKAFLDFLFSRNFKKRKVFLKRKKDSKRFLEINEKEEKIIKAISDALLIIPKILAANCGKVGKEKIEEIKRLRKDFISELNTKKENNNEREEGKMFGIDGKSGEVMDVVEKGIFDSFSVKENALKTAVDAAIMILRIDDVLSGLSKSG